MYYNRQKYTLTSPLGKLKLDIDPMGAEESETSIMRSEKTFGIFLSISNNLQFTGKAKKFLEENYALYGVQAEVELVKEVKHPKTDEWQLGFRGFFDFTTRKIKENRLSIDIEEGGLREIFASQIREKYELNRKTDITGDNIPTFNTAKLSITGRDIYLVSKLQNETKDSFELLSGKWDSGGAYRYAFRPPPLEVTANSDTQNVQNPFESINAKGGHDQGGPETKFYLIADRDRGKTIREFNISFTLDSIVDDDVDSLPEPRFRVLIRKYTNGDLYDYTESDDIVLLDVNPYNNIGQSWTLNHPDEIEPQEGESFALLFESKASYGAQFGNTGFMNLYFTDYTGSISWREDSFFKATTANFVTAHDIGKRLTEIYTGKPAFKSSLLNSGNWKELGFTCGGWLRNLRKETDQGDISKWPLTISWEDYYKSLNAIEPVAYGTTTEGNRQYIALEKFRYFFQDQVTIKIASQVSKVERQTATEFIYSSLSFGYMKGGNYEKPLGLDEFNVSTNYITPINKLDTKYEVLSPSRADSYAVEQARRMQYEDYPDEDTPYDKDNFLIDAKEEQNNHYLVRTWVDDFTKAPTGVYSPSTAFNLRLTPAHNRDRHSIIFNAGTVKTPQKSIRYTSSEGNSQLSTQIIGKSEVKENNDVLISELTPPIFEPEWMHFELPFTQELLNQIQGHSKVGDEFINNFYGLVEFINEKGIKEYGYLFEAKIKNTIKLKLLKARR